MPPGVCVSRSMTPPLGARTAAMPGVIGCAVSEPCAFGSFAAQAQQPQAVMACSSCQAPVMDATGRAPNCVRGPGWTPVAQEAFRGREPPRAFNPMQSAASFINALRVRSPKGHAEVDGLPSPDQAAAPPESTPFAESAIVMPEQAPSSPSPLQLHLAQPDDSSAMVAAASGLPSPREGCQWSSRAPLDAAAVQHGERCSACAAPRENAGDPRSPQLPAPHAEPAVCGYGSDYGRASLKCRRRCRSATSMSSSPSERFGPVCAELDAASTFVPRDSQGTFDLPVPRWACAPASPGSCRRSPSPQPVSPRRAAPLLGKHVLGRQASAPPLLRQASSERNGRTASSGYSSPRRGCDGRRAEGDDAAWLRQLLLDAEMVSWEPTAMASMTTIQVSSPSESLPSGQMSRQAEDNTLAKEFETARAILGQELLSLNENLRWAARWLEVGRSGSLHAGVKGDPKWSGETIPSAGSCSGRVAR